VYLTLRGQIILGGLGGGMTMSAPQAAIDIKKNILGPKIFPTLIKPIFYLDYDVYLIYKKHNMCKIIYFNNEKINLISIDWYCSFINSDTHDTSQVPLFNMLLTGMILHYLYCFSLTLVSNIQIQ